MSHVFGRHNLGSLPRAISGDGCYLIDSSGKRYLDASGGAAVSCLGHSDAHVLEALHKQLDQLAYAHTGFFTSEPAEALAEKLCAHTPKGLNRLYIVSSGSEAIEAALKLARQYHVENGQGARHHIIARRQSYHGNTLGALAAGGNMWRRKMFAPLLSDTSHIAPCYAWRERRENESEADYGIRTADALETEILQLGPEKIMAFIAEPVVGATAGAVPPVAGYFKRIREICDRYGVLLIFDEVMCGMGRTGTLFACTQDDVVPDIVCVAKGLGAGYQPIGGMLCQDKIYDAITQGSGFFQHGHTYLAHPMACAAALAVLERLIDDDVVGQVAPKGARLRAVLHEHLGQHPHVGDIRGRGLFMGLELVADRDQKTPFAADKKLAGVLKKAAQESGLICYPMQGTIDGIAGDHVLLAPPFIINDDEIDELARKLRRSIDQARKAVLV
ncbi:MAG: aspartate aminotransferase family protein [Pseudomonadota bacterium]